MTRVDVAFGILFFVLHNIAIFGLGYNTGFNAAIDQMKKIRNRK
jgi:Tfp pilus assembly protein PilO